MLSVDPDIRRLMALRAIESGLLRLRWLAAATRFKLAMRRHDRALKYAQKAGFNPDQSRDDHGRWTDGADTSGQQGQTTQFSASAKSKLVREFFNWTARKFISEYCRGMINREFPGEYENATIGEIWNAARSGDSRARMCMKLLKEPRFRK